MKQRYSHIGLAKLCGWFGVTRQAYYQDSWREAKEGIKSEFLIKEVLSIRKDHKRMGCRKLYLKIEPFLQEHQIKIGRDAFFNLLSREDLLVRKRKRRIKTTQSSHWLHKYPNLIRDFQPTSPNQLWVSDITYWKAGDDPVYLSFVTDVFSHKIVGYHAAQTLETVETIQALRMALSGLLMGPENHSNLIHHSDRGVQYCSSEYVKLLNKHNVKISMCENGDPLENAIAERINGIIKEEYLLDNPVESIGRTKALLRKSVFLYNEQRPHMSIGNKYPSDVHEKNLKTEKLWKNYYKKKTTIVNQF